MLWSYERPKGNPRNGSTADPPLATQEPTILVPKALRFRSPRTTDYLEISGAWLFQ